SRTKRPTPIRPRSGPRSPGRDSGRDIARISSISELDMARSPRRMACPKRRYGKAHAECPRLRPAPGSSGRGSDEFLDDHARALDVHDLDEGIGLDVEAVGRDVDQHVAEPRLTRRTKG